MNEVLPENNLEIIRNQEKIIEMLREENKSLKRTERHLRMLSVAVEQSPVCTVITDANGVIEYVNTIFTTLTGYTFEEAIGNTPRILKGNTPPEVYESLWRTVTSGKVWQGVFQNKKKNGDFYFEQAMIWPIHGVNGAITNFIAIKEDITRKLELEEQLRHSQRLDSVGQLAGGIAHDFNNILSVINGYASLLKLELSENASNMDCLNEIQTAVTRATKLTNNLLAFSRKQRLTITRVELNDLLVSSGKFLERIISEDIKLTVNPGITRLFLDADEGQLEQVFINLAANARDAMPQGGSLTIAISSINIDDTAAPVKHDPPRHGSYALITFTDTGIGMDEVTRKKIFEPFFTTKDIGKGTGLGMSIVYGIIEQHGGFIDVASRPGKGTVLSIYLPIIADGASVTEENQDVIISPRGSETILVADDDPALLRLMASSLKTLGYNVIVASDGRDALDKFSSRSDEIHLVVADAIMPNMNGLKLWGHIRELNPRVKMLLISGYSMEFLRERDAFDISMHLMMKPVNPTLFAYKIRELLDYENGA